MRFAFGRNWQDYVAHLPSAAIEEARNSLIDMLGRNAIEGKSVLDIGSGSGLFSLAAVRLGASEVHSFDYDPDSVACTQSVKQSFAPNAAHWKIERGDILNSNYLSNVAPADLVYSWGVLHHTGDMWRAISNAAGFVKPQGRFFIAIYNDQGIFSRMWLIIKKTYVTVPNFAKKWMEFFFFVSFALFLLVADVVRLRNPSRRYSGKGYRGMTLYSDIVDWIGGYPFEVASPQAIIDFMEKRDFALEKLTDVKWFRPGCNEFVFIKKAGIVP